jgi:hypothetical protein
VSQINKEMNGKLPKNRRLVLKRAIWYKKHDNGKGCFAKNCNFGCWLVSIKHLKQDKPLFGICNSEAIS